MPCVTTRTWWRSPDGPPEAAACGRGGGAGAGHGGASSRTQADHAVTVGVQRRDVMQGAQGSAPPWVPDAPRSVCSSGPPGVLHGRHGGGRVPRGCGSHAVVGGSILGRAAEPVKGPPARFGPGWRGRVPPERSVGRCRLLRSRPRLPEPPHGRPTGTAPTRGPVAGYGERPSPRTAGPAAISSERAHGPSPTGPWSRVLVAATRPRVARRWSGAPVPRAPVRARGDLGRGRGWRDTGGRGAEEWTAGATSIIHHS